MQRFLESALLYGNVEIIKYLLCDKNYKINESYAVSLKDSMVSEMENY